MVVHVVDTGAANLASVRAALRRLGVEPVTTKRAAAVESAGAVVLPGVGAFGPVMERLRADGLADALRHRIDVGRPLLAICLGFQLLFEDSEESPGVAGLGLLRGAVRAFVDAPTTPHMGWSLVTPLGRTPREGIGDHAGAGRPFSEEQPDSCLPATPFHAYFANSFRVAYDQRGGADDWSVATADYAGAFVAAIERGPLVACQFHPELSGPAGAGLMGRWLARAGALERSSSDMPQGGQSHLAPERTEGAAAC